MKITKQKKRIGFKKNYENDVNLSKYGRWTQIQLNDYIKSDSMQYKMEGQRGYRIYNESESRNEIALKNDTEIIQVEKLEIEHIDEDYD